MKNYYEAQGRPYTDYMPLTFHIATAEDLTTFTNYFYKQQSSNIWIVKPGENSNRGDRIKIFDSIDAISGHIFCALSSTGSFVV